jgi:hypothetical protein
LHPGKTGRTRPTEQGKQDRLGLVFRMMGRHDPARPKLASDLGKGRVARAA